MGLPRRSGLNWDMKFQGGVGQPCGRKYRGEKGKKMEMRCLISIDSFQDDWIRE